MASLPVASLLLILGSYVFISSAGQSPPFRGYQIVPHQTQNKEPRFKSVAMAPVKLRPPKCSLIKRSTRYENVRVPFLCHVTTGQVMPLPRDLTPGKTQVLASMKASGWNMCYKPMTVPVHRFQRIPACCPGTLPVPNGGCVCKKELLEAQNQAANMKRMEDMKKMQQMANMKKMQYMKKKMEYMQRRANMPTMRDMYRMQKLQGMQGMPQNMQDMYRMQQMQGMPQNMYRMQMMPQNRPNPGQLLQHMFQQQQQQQQQHAMQNYPTYHYRTPAPLVVQHPRPYRTMMNRGYNTVPHPGMYHNQAGPAYNNPGIPNRGRFQQVAVNNLRNSPASPINRQQPQPPQTPLSPWYNELARYMAAVMYQEYLDEYKRRSLQEEMERRAKLRKQMELWAAQQRLLQLQQGGRQPTSSPVSPNADPSPIPPPPVNGIQTTPFSMQDDPNTSGQTEEEPQTPTPTPDPEQEVVNNVQLPPSSGMLPGGSAQVNLRNMMLQAKGVVDEVFKTCLSKSGISTPLNEIVSPQDLPGLLTKVRPVCRARRDIGPCILLEGDKLLAPSGPIRQMGVTMMRNVLAMIGRICMKLGADVPPTPVQEEPEQPKITSPPVFPNPAPSMTQTVVTDSTVEKKKNDADTSGNVASDADSPLAPQTSNIVEDEPVRQFAKPLEEPSPAASSHVQETEVDVAEAAFPMWMVITMVGACAALLLLCCLTVCLVLRFRRKKKSVELDREPEKLPVPAETKPNIYAASPCIPPPAYATTAVRQTLGGGEEEEEQMNDRDFKIPEDDVKVTDENAEEK